MKQSYANMMPWSCWTVGLQSVLTISFDIWIQSTCKYVTCLHHRLTLMCGYDFTEWLLYLEWLENSRVNVWHLAITLLTIGSLTMAVKPCLTIIYSIICMTTSQCKLTISIRCKFGIDEVMVIRSVGQLYIVAAVIIHLKILPQLKLNGTWFDGIDWIDMLQL